jgi:hypothetical protein
MVRDVAMMEGEELLKLEAFVRDVAMREVRLEAMKRDHAIGGWRGGGGIKKVGFTVESMMWDGTIMRTG